MLIVGKLAISHNARKLNKIINTESIIMRTLHMGRMGMWMRMGGGGEYN